MAIDVYQIESKKRFGNIHYSLVVSEQNIKVVKNTNYFDLENEFKAGIAILKNGKKLKAEIDSFKKIAKTLEEVKKKLPRKFKVANSISPHGDYFVIKGHKITRENFLYKKIETIFAEFTKKAELKTVEGIEIKKEKISYFDDSKKAKFLLTDFNCGGDLPTKLCSSQKYGFIYR